MKNIIFAAETPLGRLGGDESFGPWGSLSGAASVGSAAREFASIISKIIGLMTIIAGIWFIFQFIIGAYGYLSSSGEPKKMSDATAKITSGLIGLIVIVAAYAIISLIGSLLGFDILNPQKLIEILGPK